MTVCRDGAEVLLRADLDQPAMMLLGTPLPVVDAANRERRGQADVEDRDAEAVQGLLGEVGVPVRPAAESLAPVEEHRRDPGAGRRERSLTPVLNCWSGRRFAADPRP
ncbi:hypothetical protein [Streptomyces atratus]|uniref:Uncharacterized protein n=1 Tax=Streptomyces atratus TaxID=1893 RepID=A0A2Z5J7V5_STRAR|nr:hypothetical protein [Streptomyces atratus]AXE76389.1 hypothetical protein C5746_04890 [Streptomyces atratus]